MAPVDRLWVVALVAVGTVGPMGGVHACTTIAAGRAATTDGSTMCAHSNDGDGGVAGNLIKVPPAVWPAGSKRAVSGGSIPQVSDTYGYFTKPGGYASTNEYQVGLAESTCNSRLKGNQTAGAVLNIVDLSELALERAKTARSAIQIMGALAETHGYYDEGESLLVIDPTDVWIFHILPDDTQKSAVWCSERVPDTDVAVVANSFTIRSVNLSQPARFMCSGNVERVAATTGRWLHGHPLDFTLVFSGPENGKKYSTGRRMWRAYTLLGDPSVTAGLNFIYNEYVSSAPYPASLPARSTLLGLSDFTTTMRDHYEGTVFDMTNSLMASGPAATPDRWLAGAAETQVLGAWERAISISRTIVSYVIQSREWLPREVGGTLWMSMHAAHTSLYIPFPVGHTMAASPELPKCMWNNSMDQVGRGVSFFQASRFVHNAAQHHYYRSIGIVKASQRTLETAALQLQAEQDSGYQNHTASMIHVAKKFNDNAQAMVSKWWELADQLVLTGGVDSGHDGYPQWFLEDDETGYTEGPPPAPAVPPTVAQNAR